MRIPLHVPAVFAVAALLPAQSSSPRPQFDVASIKPNNSESTATGYGRPPDSGKFTATNNTLQLLVTTAYKVKNFQISGGPSWLQSAKYDISAESAETHVSQDRWRLMLQALLADRFQLALHRETKEMPVYVLTVSKSGNKVLKVADDDCVKNGADKGPPVPPAPGKPAPLPCGAFFMGPTALGGKNISMPFFIEALSSALDRTVIDKTGFTGTFDVDLKFSPDGMTSFGPAGFSQQGLSSANSADSSLPSIFTALQEQLGLRLESTRGPAEVLVVDHIERPSLN